MNCEILAPAGGEQSAYVALNSGADAVYLGLSQFSARQGAENFDLPALFRVCSYAHVLGAKVYVALNTLVKEEEIAAFFSLAREAWNAGADALILQDVFLGKQLKRTYPEICLHLSTQGGCCNEYGARLAKEYGFSRVVLARETPMEEIRRIASIIETEGFVQGALCSSFSGQCYFSSFVGNNSGNRGRCKQPCRKKYSIDRSGYEEEAYALSLSDLCMEKSARTLVEAGVYSLKIEGRMRRPEYVAAAVSYYRAIFGDGSVKRAFSDLSRAYNRGDYTHGLAFGQDKTFLSRNVQGHVGERVGTLSLRGGKWFCESDYPACEGDGFKLLRSGKEVGGGRFCAAEKQGFYLNVGRDVRIGDEVRVTTDVSSSQRLLSAKRTREIAVRVRIVAGEYPVAECGDVRVVGDLPVQEAKSAPLTEAQIKENFSKTDTMPLSVTFDCVQTENAFMPKSALNAFRRDFYGQLLRSFSESRSLEERAIPFPPLMRKKGDLTAVITTELGEIKADVIIYKPADYSEIPPFERGHGAVYLYLPPFFTSSDEEKICDQIDRFDGIYGEGSYAILLARKYRKPLFAGTGLNLSNSLAVQALKEEGVAMFALSKELTDEEQTALALEGAFALSAGSIKLMDLVYCPFERTCKECDRRERYTLTDEGGRAFPLRRYCIGGACRFEVYNCASLATFNGATSVLVDLSVEEAGQAAVSSARSPERGKEIFQTVTSGHGNKSLL